MRKSEGGPSGPRICAVIVSIRDDMIRGCLNSILKADSPKIDEITAVTSYNADELKKEYPSVNFILLPEKSISRKRNVGIMNTEADIIAFTDDDCSVSTGWAAGIKELLFEKGYQAVFGRTIVEKSGNPFNTELEKPGFRTCNAFFRRDALIKAGCFDERFDIQREDSDITFTIIENGGRYFFSEKNTVIHRKRKDSYFDLSKSASRTAYDLMLKKKHPVLFKKFKERLIPLKYLPFAFLLFFAAAGTFLEYRITLYSIILYFIYSGVLSFIYFKGSFIRFLSGFFDFCTAPLIRFSGLIKYFTRGKN
ncbi:MAG: glycosyltransferase family 2 protein [Fibrobacterota bacterium]